MKNTFHADSFYVDHRARENKQELKGGAKRRPPPRGPKGPLGPGGALWAPPWALGVGGGGWGHAETRTSRTHERAKTCTCKARRKQARVDGNYPQGKIILSEVAHHEGCLPIGMFMQIGLDLGMCTCICVCAQVRVNMHMHAEL